MKLVAVLVIVATTIAASSAAPKLHESEADIGPRVEGIRAKTSSPLDTAYVLAELDFKTRDDLQDKIKEIARLWRCAINVIDSLSNEYGFSNEWQPIKLALIANIHNLENCRHEECMEIEISKARATIFVFLDQLEEETIGAIIQALEDKCVPDV